MLGRVPLIRPLVCFRQPCVEFQVASGRLSGSVIVVRIPVDALIPSPCRPAAGQNGRRSSRVAEQAPEQRPHSGRPVGASKRPRRAIRNRQGGGRVEARLHPPDAPAERHDQQSGRERVEHFPASGFRRTRLRSAARPTGLRLHPFLTDTGTRCGSNFRKRPAATSPGLPAASGRCRRNRVDHESALLPNRETFAAALTVSPGRALQKLAKDPFDGALFVFRDRQRTVASNSWPMTVSQGFWPCQKSRSQGRVRRPRNHPFPAHAVPRRQSSGGFSQCPCRSQPIAAHSGVLRSRSTPPIACTTACCCR